MYKYKNHLLNSPVPNNKLLFITLMKLTMYNNDYKNLHNLLLINFSVSILLFVIIFSVFGYWMVKNIQKIGNKTYPSNPKIIQDNYNLMEKATEQISIQNSKSMASADFAVRSVLDKKVFAASASSSSGIIKNSSGGLKDLI